MSNKRKKCVIIPLTDKARRLQYVPVATQDNGGLRRYKVEEYVYLLPSEIKSIERRKERQKGKSELTVYQIMEKREVTQKEAYEILKQLENDNFENTSIDDINMYKVDIIR